MSFSRLMNFTDLNLSREEVTPQKYGAVGDNTTDDLAAFQSAGVGALFVPDATYKLSSDYTPAATNSMIAMGPSVKFGTSKYRVDNLIPRQVTPIFARQLTSVNYDTSWAGYGNVFQRASYAKASLATVPIVAYFGEGEAAAASSKAWGGNFVGVASVSGGIGIGVEVDAVATTSGALTYGVVVASAGTTPAQTAVQIQGNNSASAFGNGIYFNGASGFGITGSLILADSSISAAFGLNFGGTYSTAEVSFPSFSVSATPGSINSKVQISGSASGNTTIAAAGAGGTPATNANLNMKPLGTGGSQLTDSASVVKVRADSTGIAFFAGTTAAKQTVTGSKGANAALTSLMAALVAYGLVTDTTS